jgi:(2Fe-2S) ferredoxin
MSSRKIKSVLMLEGQFLSFVAGSEFKYFNLLTVEGEHCIKLSKELRRSLMPLQPGDRLQILGEKSVDWQTGVVKLKAHRLLVGAAMPLPAMPVAAQSQRPQPEPAPKITRILFCQKSDCMKRGGNAVCAALAAALDERQLNDRVSLSGTGCMKNCKAGPNLAIPGKGKYDRVTVGQVPDLIDKHFPACASEVSASTSLSAMAIS